MKGTQITRDEWLAAFSEAQQPADPDAVTTSELADQLRVSDSTARRLVRRLLAQKRARRTVKIVQRVDGHATRVTAYRLLNGAKK